MTALPNFIVTGNVKEILGTVTGTELDEAALTRAKVIFISNLDDDQFLTWGGEIKRARNIVEAFIDTDGDIVDEDGNPIRLLAQDDGLNIRGLQWQLRITIPSQVLPPLPGGRMRAFWFDAGADTETIPLGTVVPVIGERIHGVTPGGGDMLAAIYDPTNVNDDAFDRANHHGTLSADDLADGSTNHAFTAADDTKLGGIESLADVTDAGNVAAAGAIMDGDFSTNGLMKRTGAGAYATATAGTDYYNPTGTDVAVADGGTGSSTAGGARANLGLAIGTDVQAQDPELSALAGLTSAADKLPYFTGSGTAALADLTSFARTLLDDADAATMRATLGVGTGGGDASTNTATSVDSEVVLFSGTAGKTLKRASITGLAKLTSGVLSAATAGTDYYNPTGTDVAVADGGTGSSTAGGARANLGLVIGTDVQAQDPELAAIAGLTSAADRLPYFTGSGTAALATFTTAGRALIDDADATAQRATLGLGSAAVLAASTTPTASTVAEWDASVNLSANALFKAFTTTPTAAGTTTLTITSTQIQILTGVTTQIVKLPTTSVPQGGQYFIVNQSTGAVTVQSSGSNTIVIIAAGAAALFTAVIATPTTAANWDARYWGSIFASGKSLTVNNTITLTGTDGTTMTLPGSSATLASLAAIEVFTNKTIGVSNIINARDDHFSIANSVDATKALILSATSIATATTRTATFPDADITVVGTTTTQTLSGKRNTKRVTPLSNPGATPTINTDNCDAVEITGQTADITNMTTNLTGTPNNFDQLSFAITGTAARAITWGTKFEAGPTALPTTTVTTQRLDVDFRWNAVTSKWRCMASGSA